MKAKYIQITSLALLFFNIAVAQDSLKSDNSGYAEKVNLAYQTLDKIQTTGSISVSNPDEILKYDSRQNISSALTNKVVGLSGTNLHGLGNVIYVVDGVVKDVDYLNLLEVEQITVLKDAVSRLLYGADSDTGVVLITTKRGEFGKNKIKFNVEYGMQKAIAYPKYLDAATYMEVYDRAYLNDGGSLSALTYSTDLINNTRNKVDPFLYPDVDYYSDTFVKDLVGFSNVYGEASGGNDRVRYYMNLGWKRNEQWYKSESTNMQDILSVRGKVDFDVTKWLRMNMDAVAVFDITNSPNVSTFDDGEETETFWTKASTYLPNSFPLLIPVSKVANYSDLTGVNAINNQFLMGGTSVYQDNLLGDLSKSGTLTRMNRYIQFKTGLDLDLNGITKGLTANGMFSFEFNNTYFQAVQNSYAIYQIDEVDENGNFIVSKIGNDKVTTEQTIDYNNMDFNRKAQAHLNINYQRSFGKFDVAALLMGNLKKYWQNDVAQDVKKMSWGFSANSMYDKKYILEVSGLMQGSNKLSPDNRWGMSYAAGAGWIMSNEKFMKDVDWLDYLKIRANYGEIKNDNWTVGTYSGYFLYDSNYTSSTVWNYNNGANKNNSILISSLGNVYSWQTRKELNVGFEANLFNKRTWIEVAYFNSLYDNQLTEMKNSTPSTLGSTKVYENYNSTRYSGIELGVSHTEKWNKFTLTAGVNYMFNTSEILKYEEPIYDTEYNKHRTRIGTYANALIGYEAERLYAPEDFDSYGNLVAGLPENTFGDVKPGDIKYVDYNKDGKITEDDQYVLGRNGNNHSVAININMSYDRWSLYIQANGGFGGKGFLNSDYYWFKGNQAKYSEIALKSYNPDAPDPNAEYPRLTLTNGNNNYRNSSFWIYDRSQFSLAAVQLSYDFKLKKNLPLSGLQAYLRGSNLFMIAKDKDVLELNVGTAPQNRVFALGLVATF